MTARSLLLTGRPGVGKTTVMRKVAADLSDRRLAGFTTDEVREAGQRVGFRIVTFDGRHDRLAHVRHASRHRVGRYGVDVVAIERMVEQTLGADSDLVLVDEIGKMECFSARFVGAMRSLLDERRPLVATIALRGSGFIAEVKARPDVEIWEVTHANRDAMPSLVVERIRSWR